MTEIGIFIVGCAVTLVWVSAVSLLIWAETKDSGRNAFPRDFFSTHSRRAQNRYEAGLQESTRHGKVRR